MTQGWKGALAVMQRCLACAAAALVLLLLAWALPWLNALGAGWGDVDRLAGSIVDKLGELQRRGVNVTVYVERVNEALKEAERGDYSGALSALQGLSAEVDEALAATEGAPLRLAVVKAVKVGILLSIPLLVYLLLPRVYLHLWYLSRREWVVEEAWER